MVLFKRTVIILSVFSLAIWFLGSNKIFSIKDDVTDFALVNKISSPVIDSNPNMNAYFGDLHVHTKYSFDAFIFGTMATPDDAYKYAKGNTIKHPLGFDMQLEDPLDFYAVTDHAAWLGMLPAYANPDSVPGKMGFAKDLHGLNDKENLTTDSLGRRVGLFRGLITGELIAPTYNPLKLLKTYLQEDTIYGTKAFDRETHQSAWKDSAEAAERHNEPGKFTTFIAYEFTSSGIGQSNLHRNVVFKTSQAPVQPFSIVDSRNPEDLWDWMDILRGRGVESLAIPHNSNGSNGEMFKTVDWSGKPFSKDYSSKRIRNEPLVEITQVKGTSDSHPLLSPNDEWADFEIMNNRVASPFYSRPEGSYVRNAYLRGLTLESEYSLNPYKFGLIGSSDTHTGAISDNEAEFNSKAGIIDGTSALRGVIPIDKDLRQQIEGSNMNVVISGFKTIEDKDYIQTTYTEWGASGLAAVWAENNTRESIYNAFRRKETFATTGSRIKVRFFAGYDLQNTFKQKDPVAFAYSNGVSMGSDIFESEEMTPSFLVWAIRDIKRAPLDRVQIIKGWTEPSGKPHEKVFDVACSDGNEPDPITNRCVDNGADVNLENCDISDNVGTNELKTVWKDPEFDASIKSFYYVRVLENPTCRWSTWDALKSDNEPRPDIPSVIQERAWSSPIWYIPNSRGIVAANILPDDL